MTSSLIDVCLGLVFAYFVFSLTASRINEKVASLWQWRAKGLEDGLRTLFGPPDAPSDNAAIAADAVQPAARTDHPGATLSAKAIKNHPIIAAFDAGLAKNRRVSYLPARAVSAAVLDILAPATANGPAGDPMTTVVASLAQLDDTNFAKQTLLRMATDAKGDRDRFRAKIENWFDDQMDRISGRYKRRVQFWILIYSAVLVVVFNVDSISMAEGLWLSPTRQAVAVQAASGASQAQPGDTGTSFSDLRGLSLPIGWSMDSTAPSSTDSQAIPKSPWQWILKALGLAISLLALSFGAPFWFDVLGKFARVRNSGSVPPRGGRSTTA